ncbi:MAG: restriction endonuclease subunit S [Bacteroidales bacterium]|nr:restriction endonuclease subunit S [Bacteroidales bacterium]
MSNYPTYKLSEVADILDSFRKPINSTERTKRIQGKTENELYPYYGATGQVGLIDEYLTDGEYVLVGEDGAPFLEPFKNKSYIIRGKAWVNNHAHILSGKKDVLSNQYLNYFLNSFDYRNYVNGTTRLKLTQGNLTQIPIPLPPLPTQHAIVSRIETLFAELDKAVQHLRTAQQQLKTYRQAVLNHWLNNDDGKWEMVKLGEVAEKIQIGPFGTQLHKSDYINGGIPLINPMHISNNKIQPDKSFSVSEEKYKELSNYYLQKDDVILGRRGEMGRCAVVSENEDGMLCGTGSLYIRGGSAFCADYLCKLLSSQKIVMYFENASSGTTMSNLNRGIIENCEIPLPPLTDQHRIVQEIESRLSQAEAAEASIAEALQKTEALRQSILKKAFSGELNL